MTGLSLNAPEQINALRQLGWALVHTLWEFAALALVAAVLLAFTRRPQWRYVISTAALATMVAAAVVTLALAVGRSANDGMHESASNAARPLLVNEPPSPVLIRGIDSGTADVPIKNAAAASRAISATPSAVQSVPWRVRVAAVFNALLPALPAVYLAGVLLFTLRLMTGLRRVRLLVRAGTALPPPWQARVAALVRRLGVSRAARILVSAAAEVPCVVGGMRPVVLVPAEALAKLAAEQVEALLAHELAHLRRWDDMVNLAQCVVETLLFYHPAIWWISARMREEREHCCDDMALAVCGDQTLYATALASMEQMRGASRLTPAAHGGSLLRRIARVLGNDLSKKPMRTKEPNMKLFRGGRIVIATVAILVAVGLAHDLWPARAQTSSPIDGTSRVPAPASAPASAGAAASPTPAAAPGSTNVSTVTIDVPRPDGTKLHTTVSVPPGGTLLIGGKPVSGTLSQDGKNYVIDTAGTLSEAAVAPGTIAVDAASAAATTTDTTAPAPTAQELADRGNTRLQDLLKDRDNEQKRLAQLRRSFGEKNGNIVLEKRQLDALNKAIDDEVAAAQPGTAKPHQAVNGNTFTITAEGGHVTLRNGQSEVVADKLEFTVSPGVIDATGGTMVTKMNNAPAPAAVSLNALSAKDQADLHAHEAEYAEAKSQYERVKIAYDNKAVSTAELEKAQAELLVAQAHVEAAKAQADADAATPPGEYYLMGAVSRPGVYSLTGRKINILQALAAAGMDMADADVLVITLVRRDDPRKETKTSLSFKMLMDIRERDVYLKPYDVLIVTKDPEAARRAAMEEKEFTDQYQILIETQKALEARLRDVQLNLDLAKALKGENQPDVVNLTKQADALQAQLEATKKKMEDMIGSEKAGPRAKMPDMTPRKPEDIKPTGMQQDRLNKTQQQLDATSKEIDEMGGTGAATGDVAERAKGTDATKLSDPEATAMSNAEVRRNEKILEMLQSRLAQVKQTPGDTAAVTLSLERSIEKYQAALSNLKVKADKTVDAEAVTKQHDAALAAQQAQLADAQARLANLQSQFGENSAQVKQAQAQLEALTQKVDAANKPAATTEATVDSAGNLTGITITASGANYAAVPPPGSELDRDRALMNVVTARQADLAAQLQKKEDALKKAETQFGADDPQTQLLTKTITNLKNLDANMDKELDQVTAQVKKLEAASTQP